MNLSKGTQADKVYKALLSHEFMSKDKLIAKTKITSQSVSTVLTLLRRAGLAEYSGHMRMKGGLRWKKHPIQEPLYPPQEDLIHKKSKNTKKLILLETPDMIIDRIVKDLILLRTEIRRTNSIGSNAIQALSRISEEFKP